MARPFAFMLTLMLIGVAIGSRVRPGVVQQVNTVEQISQATDAQTERDIAEHDATVLQEDAQSGKPENPPAKYESYVKPIVEEIQTGSPVVVTNAQTGETGVVSFYLVGGCPSTFCGDQAQIVSYFGDKAVAYWAKPGKDAADYRNFNTKGPHKNDSDNLKSLDAKIAAGGEAAGDMGTATFRGQLRTYIMQSPGDKVYISLVYLVTWSTVWRTSAGWLFFQREDGSVYRRQFKMDKNMNFDFKGIEVGPLGADEVWPQADGKTLAI